MPFLMTFSESGNPMNHLSFKSSNQNLSRIGSVFISLSFVLCLLTFTSATAYSGSVIIHTTSTGSEDGDPAKDADGVKNGKVVWAGGGTVHVVLSAMFYVSPSLEIQSGAIVKFASEGIIVGGVTIYKAGGEMYVYDNATLTAQGVTFTSIHDDESISIPSVLGPLPSTLFRMVMPSTVTLWE